MTLSQRLRAAAIAFVATGFGLALAPAAQAQVAPPGCQGNPSATWLNVTVEGLRNGNGLLAVTLYPDDSRKFLAKHGSIKVSRFAASAGTVRSCIFVPAPGVYALVVYHDEDGSRKLNRSALGLPREGFGFSNNPGTFAGIPVFRSVRLNVPRGGLTTRIRLRYP